jgi:RNA polymerase-binding transcription factor
MRARRASTGRTGESTRPRRVELRQFLEARRKAVDESIRERLASFREERAAADHVGGQDDGEVSEADVQEDIELAVLQLQRETVERIDAALTRLDHGLYGRCTECGDDITTARLRALPFAVRCLDCEEAREADTARHRSQGRRLVLFGEASLRLG